MKHHIQLYAFSFAALSFFACGHSEKESPKPATTAANLPPTSHQLAADRIVKARCDREAACDNVGEKKTYATREACASALSHEEDAGVGVSECATGVNETDLQDCLRDIREEKCGHPFDTLDRLASCRASKLCVAK